jgi:F0F1-type ATP synthase assembly protein I
MTGELKDKLKKLEKDLEQFHAHYKPTKKTTEKKSLERQKISKQNNEEASSSVKHVATIGIEILSGAAVGAFLGYYCDEFFTTKPLCFIIFMILGVAGGFVNIIKKFK